MKRISTIVVVVVALALGATTYAAVLRSNAGSLKTVRSHRALVVTAQVSGLLYPGSVRPVKLRIKNLLSRKVRILALQLKTGRPSGGCPAWAVTGGRLNVRMTIARRGVRTAYASVRMLATAPDACEAASVPLSFSATLDGQP